MSYRYLPDTTMQTNSQECLLNTGWSEILKYLHKFQMVVLNDNKNAVKVGGDVS